MAESFSLMDMNDNETCNDGNLGNKIGGIDKAYIENMNDYQIIQTEMLCPVCLKILLDPKECNVCHTMVCSDCDFILTYSGKKCVKSNCDGEMVRSNKYIREILEQLRIKCHGCRKGGFSYKEYINHIATCPEYLQTPIQKILREIKKKDEEIRKLKTKVRDGLDALKDQPERDEKLRKKYLTHELSSNDKMLLYDAALGNPGVESFQTYIEKRKFPMFEEVSSPGCYWTPLHYAMHYGKWETIEYILNYCIKKGIYNDIMRLKSNDKRDPVLCLLRSSALDTDKKKEVFRKLINKFEIIITPNIRKDLSIRNMTYLLDERK